MSELQTSREDKFFGVSYQVEDPDQEPKTKEASDDVELEIIDDTPKKPQKADSVQEDD